MTVVPVTCGGVVEESDRSNRTTVQFPATGVPLSVEVLPPRALDTNSDAVVGVDSTVMSQGPKTFLLLMVSTGVPLASRTMRHPAGLFFGSAPPVVVGKLPTTTQPPGRIPSAVESPIPPGQVWPSGSCESCAKSCTDPWGEICTMVVPVPCTFALLLKLLTRVSPATREPVVVGTEATP